MLTNVHKLNIYQCKNINDVGNLRNLKILITDSSVIGIHLLKNLEVLHIDETCCKKSSYKIDYNK